MEYFSNMFGEPNIIGEDLPESDNVDGGVQYLNEVRDIEQLDDSGVPGSYKFDSSYFVEYPLRRIDFVLAYFDSDDDKNEKRRIFQSSLESAGLQLESEKSAGSSQRLTFIKIHIPGDTLLRNANILDIKYGTRRDEEEVWKFWKFVLACIKRNFFSSLHRMRRSHMVSSDQSGTEINVPREGASKMSFQSVLSEDVDPEVQFSEKDRISVVWNMLKRTRYGQRERNFGILRLLELGVYTAAYPLHSGTCKEDPPDGNRNLRRTLYVEWACLKSAFLKEQPLDLVRDYFGEEVGLYFAWMAYYIDMLLYATIAGLLVFFYGVFSWNSSDTIPSKEICNSDFIICPRCRDESLCKSTYLKVSCPYARLSYYFDNPATVFFAVFMTFWATVFVRVWKRREAVISWRWNLFTVDYGEIRPQFEMSTKHMRQNPITRNEEFYVPLPEKISRYFISTAIVIVMTTAATAVCYSLILYRIDINETIRRSPNTVLRNYHEIIASLSSSVLSLTTMLIFAAIFQRMSVALTNLEKPRTQSEFDVSFTFKMFVFEFINDYTSLIYTAFFKGTFYQHPGYIGKKHSLEEDICDPGGCLSEVFMQLIVTMAGKQIIFVLFRVFKPIVSIMWSRFRYGSIRGARFPRWEMDYHMIEFQSTTIFFKQLDMVMQYGFVILFVASFPLAPLLAFINNIFEVRIVAYNLLVNTRRPVPRKVEGLGAFNGVLECLTYLAVVFNAFLIAYTSDFLPRTVYKFQHDGDLRGYVNHSLSIFAIKDFPSPHSLSNTTCRYRGHRLPPDSPHKYWLSENYWKIISWRFVFVIAFEHVVALLNGALAFGISTVPRRIRKAMMEEYAAGIQTKKHFSRYSRK